MCQSSWHDSLAGVSPGGVLPQYLKANFKKIYIIKVKKVFMAGKTRSLYNPNYND